MRLEEFIQEYAVALLSGAFLERQSYQIPKAALRQRVLAREETIIRIQSDLMAVLHGPGQQGTTKLSGICSEYWAVDEKPDVRTVPRSRALDGYGDLKPLTCGSKSCGVCHPRLLVEIHSEKPTGFVGK
jgi:hypothetical protein